MTLLVVNSCCCCGSNNNVVFLVVVVNIHTVLCIIITRILYELYVWCLHKDISYKKISRLFLYNCFSAEYY